MILWGRKDRTSTPVLLVADMLQPVDGLAVELLVDGGVRQGRRRRGAVPVLFAGRDPDDIARADFLDRPAPPLYPATARRDQERLAERMRVPSGPRAGLKGDARPGRTRGGDGLDQGVNPHRAGEPVGRALGGRLRSASFDFHVSS